MADLLEQLFMDEARHGVFHNSSMDIYNYSILDFYNMTNFKTPPTINLGRAFTIALAAIGIIANVSSLAAMLHVSGKYSANQRLIISLITSDLFVSLIVLVFMINNALLPFFLPDIDYGRKLCVYMTLKSLVMMGHSISLFNLVVLSFDHFLAINKPLKYTRIFTGKRVSFILAGIWFLAGLCGFSDFLVPSPQYSYCQGRQLVNFCEIGYCTKYETEYLIFPLVHVCFLIMAFFYTRVFLTIFQYQRMNGRHQPNMQRNIKGLVTTLIILGTFLVCWLPHGIFETYFLIKILTDHMAAMKSYRTFLKVNFYLYALWLVNSICDPIIYAVRMREVKTGYYRMIKCRLGEVCDKTTKNGSRPVSSFCRKSTTSAVTTGMELTENHTLMSVGIPST